MTIARRDFWWWARMFEWLRTCRAMPSICSNQPGALLFMDSKKSPNLTVIKDFWRQKFPHLLRCARYLEPVILALSRIWTEMDSMREHRLLRFKLLRRLWSKLKHTKSGSTMFHLLGCCRKHCHMQPFLPILSVKGNSLNSFQVKGSNRCFYILLVISFLVISCHFEGLYGFWGWNLAFVWTDQLDHVLTCSDILLKLIRFSFEVKSFRHAVDCTILAIIQFKGRKR